jgi:hypothetical protein
MDAVDQAPNQLPSLPALSALCLWHCGALLTSSAAVLLARLVNYFTRFFLWPAFGCSQHLVFFWPGVWVRSFLVFFYRHGRIKRKQALFFIVFSGFSLHGEFKHNSTYFPPKILQKTAKNPQKPQQI